MWSNCFNDVILGLENKKDIISAGKGENGDKNKVKIDYKTKGMMAQIGKRTGVAVLFNKIALI
jgi:hypothetical protein